MREDGEEKREGGGREMKKVNENVSNLYFMRMHILWTADDSVADFSTFSLAYDFAATAHFA